jgi:hypothetical protein
MQWFSCICMSVFVMIMSYDFKIKTCKLENIAEVFAFQLKPRP